MLLAPFKILCSILLFSGFAASRPSPAHKKRLINVVEAVDVVKELLLDEGGYVHGQGKYNHNCTAENRARILEDVPRGYNTPIVFTGQVFFHKLPFSQDHVVEISANGLPPIVFAVNRQTTLLNTFYTSAVMTHVTCRYEDIGDYTTICHTVVTLGVTGLLSLPAKFKAAVYFAFEPEFCEIIRTSAYATVPAEILGLPIDMPGLPHKQLFGTANKQAE